MAEDLEQKEVADEDADWFLQNLVSSVNKGAVSFTITLNVGGLLVSGMLISGRTYFKEFGSQFEDAFPSDGEKERTIEKAIHNLTKIYDEPESGEGSSQPPPRYIHLRDAKFYHPSLGGAMPSQGILWRGRLNVVEGFFLGSFHESEPKLE